MAAKYKKIRLSKTKTMDEHRYIMSKHLGRELSRYEHVHHIDENKLNNNISNLVILSQSEHARHHMKGNSPKEETRNKLRLASIKNIPNTDIRLPQVIEIKKQLAIGKKCFEIANSTGAKRQWVSEIKRGLKWAWVQV